MSAPTHLLTLNGAETVAIVGVDQKDGLACVYEICTTQDIADLAGGAGRVPGNPTAVAGSTAINGTALSYMRSDAAPAVQLASPSQFGIVKVDNSTITEVGGVISAAVPIAGDPTGIAGPIANNGASTNFMRADATPAVQKGSNSQFGIVQVDGTTITSTLGVISAAAAPANPTATAGPNAVNGSAVTYMRSDAAPAVQVGSSSQKGILQVDGTTITATAGVISAVSSASTGANPTATVGATAVNGSATTFMRSDAAPPIKNNFILSDITFVMNGAGVAITTGVKGYIFIDFNCTIQQATLLADQTGSIVVDIWECSYAQFDAGSTHPVAGDKITGSTPPTISSGVKSQDSTLSGWNTTISASSVLAFVVNSATTIQQVTLALKVVKT
jgi:hypothetical protein